MCSLEWMKRQEVRSIEIILYLSRTALVTTFITMKRPSVEVVSS